MQGPPIPSDITGQEMDRGTYKDIVNGLGPRGPEAAQRIVAAIRAVDEGDQQGAALHADIARRLGTRLAPVREAVGLVCYEIGEYEVALRDLRAAQRMSGALDLLPVIADCERAIGRPQRALDMAVSPEAGQLDVAGQVELLIVAAGARGDLGQHAAAVETLRIPLLASQSTAPWQERLWYAYADVLVKDGRPQEALDWFRRAARHPEKGTDAGERFVALRSGTVAAGPAEVGPIVDLDEHDASDDESPVTVDGPDQDTRG